MTRGSEGQTKEDVSRHSRDLMSDLPVIRALAQRLLGSSKSDSAGIRDQVHCASRDEPDRGDHHPASGKSESDLV
jgi:hypothetical protein